MHRPPQAEPDRRPRPRRVAPDRGAGLPSTPPFDEAPTLVPGDLTRANYERKYGPLRSTPPSARAVSFDEAPTPQPGGLRWADYARRYDRDAGRRVARARALMLGLLVGALAVLIGVATALPAALDRAAVDRPLPVVLTLLAVSVVGLLGAVAAWAWGRRQDDREDPA